MANQIYVSDRINATIRESDKLAVTVQETDFLNIASDIYNPPFIPFLTDIGDVDTAILENGAVLVYDAISQTWKSTILLALQEIDGGTY